MKILTERCIIQNFDSDDIDSFMEYRNDMEWMRYQGVKGMPKEVYEKELLYNTSLEKGKQFAIKDTTAKQLIGDIYLRKESSIYWLGYTIHPAYARKGYAKEVVAATIAWIANQRGSIIKASVFPENIASIGLLEKLNFTYFAKEDDELVYTYNLSQDVTDFCEK